MSEVYEDVADLVEESLWDPWLGLKIWEQPSRYRLRRAAKAWFDEGGVSRAYVLEVLHAAYARV